MNNRRHSSLIIFVFLLALGLGMAGEALAQQPLTMPRPSQKAKIFQTIGLTDMQISYNRPGVNGREIWGKLVPFDAVWRAGANENTVISFSDDVKVNGKMLKAGKYGIHMIPSTGEWTVIFSNITTAWGSFAYQESDDALRIMVKPESAPFEERLSFRFDNPTDNSVEIAMYWEKKRVPFKVGVDANTVVLDHIRKELYGLPRFGWQGWNQAAAYCVQNGINLDEAAQWIDRSINMNKNFTNLRTKSLLLAKQNMQKESDELMEEAFKMATENEMNAYGYQLMGQGKLTQAIGIFEKNVKDHPKSWNVHDSLAEAYARAGDMKKAKKFYTAAMKLSNDESQKKRISAILSEM